MDEQNKFNVFFCTEMIIARFRWRSNKYIDDQFIPFDEEIVNTLKENFVYEKGSATIGIINEGLYQIKIGFFGKKVPKIKIFNHDQIIYENKPTSKSIEKSIFCKSALIFRNLPNNSFIKISCIGQFVYEGFLDIKRL